MSDQRDDNRPPLLEVLQRLDQIVAAFPGTRLLVDMARDATSEATRQQAKLLSQFRRLRRKRERWRDQSHRLLDVLALSPAVLDPRAALSADTLLEPFSRLKLETYPTLARRLHEAAGKVDARDYQVLLIDAVLRHGLRPLVEAQLLQPDHDRAALRERLRGHLAGRLARHLGKQVGYRVVPETGALIDDLIRQSLILLDDLLHTSPPARLFWPDPGTRFDPELHARSGGKPGNEHRLVRGTLFPGLRLFGPEPRILDRAIVATRRDDE